MQTLDCIDQNILDVLTHNARATSAEIARQTGLPGRTVNHRLRRLFDQEVIKAAIVINPRAFGYTLAVDIFCELEPGYMNQAVELLTKMPEITYIALSTGDQDLSVQAIFKTIDDLQSFLTNKIHQVPGIRRTKTVLIPQILKDTYVWRPQLDCLQKEVAETENHHPGS